MGPPLSPLQAYDDVMTFAAACGEDALRLVMHAAVPQVLRPELLHLLRLNFVPEAGDDPSVEADVLFAPFCAHLGGGYYRFDDHARRQLLKQLDPLYHSERAPRSQRVGSFLLSYFDEQRRLLAGSTDAVRSAYVEVERWVALAFFDPSSAAQQLASAVRDASAGDEAAARLRIGGLSGALSTPLAHHQPLLAYAAGIAAVERGRLDEARDLFEPLGDREIAVGTVTLRSPRAVLDERLQPTVEKISAVAVQAERAQDTVEPPAETMQPESVGGRATIFISYSHKDERWRDELETFLRPLASRVDFEVWSDRKIPGGAGWKSTINEALGRARVAVLLVSPDYLASGDVLREEIPQLEERVRAGTLRLLWIPVRDCLWQESAIANYQAACDPSRPLASLSESERDHALVQVARAIERVFAERKPAPAATPPDPDIFVCYRRGGDDGRVYRLADRLKAAFGAGRIFLDVTSIPAGESFLQMIQRRVDASAIMVVVIDREWLDARDERGRRRLDRHNDILRLELAAALRQKIRVLPVLIGGASMPSEDEMPADIASLARWNAVNLTDDSWDEGINRVTSVIDQTLHGDGPQRPSVATVAFEPERLFLVIQRELTTQEGSVRVFNLDARLSSTGRQSVTVQKMELELTDPRGATMRMPWMLFYEYAQAGVMQRHTEAQPVKLHPSSDRALGIQFRVETPSPETGWPAGTYGLRWYAWLSDDEWSARPDWTQSYQFTIDSQVERQIRQWAHASDDMWRSLNDPHNAVAIPLALRRPEGASPRGERA